MNIFRLVGDLAHLSAIVILLLKIRKTRSCAGISGKPSRPQVQVALKLKQWFSTFWSVTAENNSSSLRLFYGIFRYVKEKRLRTFELLLCNLRLTSCLFLLDHVIYDETIIEFEMLLDMVV